MAYLLLQDFNYHSTLVNLDQINSVQEDQGTLFIYYSVDENGPVKITSPLEQEKLLGKLDLLPNFFDARDEGIGHYVNMNSIKFTELDQGTLFIHFFGNSGPRNSCQVTNESKYAALMSALGSYRGGVGGGGGSRWMRRRGI